MLLARILSCSALAALALATAAQPQSAPAPADAVDPGAGAVMPEEGGLRTQVMLDRAGFSVGEIDGKEGSNTRRAQASFQRHRGDGAPVAHASLPASADGAPTLVDYTLTAEDVKGPFVKVPQDMMAKAKLPALGYSSPAEKLGEKFHSSPALLQRLNPGKSLDRAGETIRVPNVRSPIAGKAAYVIVDKSDSFVAAMDAQNKVLARYPATMGSEHDPLPLGNWKVTGVTHDPPFNYNPDLFWDAKAAHSKAKIAPGPNNPVGVVWIDLSKEHYGIHGAPEPSKIGKTESHGCIRLTNWDAAELAKMVSPGVVAILQE
jgi:lipoprotein-anchoring transpeptidase ErfK/SrfK